MKRFSALALSMVAVAVLFQGTARSASAIDEKVLTAVYHEGLKSFFAGDYTQSVATLTQAIDGGSKNPSCYYFRGLAQSRLGRGAEARKDFTTGAELEGQDFNVFFNASQSLERIQGPERRVLETYRAAGRKNALAAVEKIRLEQFHRFDPAQAAPTAPASAAPAAEGVPAAEGPNPFGAQPAMPAGGAAPAADPFGSPMPSAPQPAPAGASPFGAPAAPAGGNPFGAPATQPPAAQPPSAQPTAAPAANPFGS